MSADLLNPVPATMPRDVEPARILAVLARDVHAQAQRARLDLVDLADDLLEAALVAALPRSCASQPRRVGAVPLRIRPRNSIRWSKSSAWNASIPSASKKQRGVFRSCSSGVGLRSSEMHFAPDVERVRPLVDRGDPAPMTM